MCDCASIILRRRNCWQAAEIVVKEHKENQPI
jgi:hypothetical protein